MNLFPDIGPDVGDLLRVKTRDGVVRQFIVMAEKPDESGARTLELLSDPDNDPCPAP